MDWGRLLSHLPIIAAPGFVAGEWEGGEKRADGSYAMPWWQPSTEAEAFVADVFASGAGFTFAWVDWAEQQPIELLRDPEAVADADLMTCRRLLTMHVRRNRFFEGHLEWAFGSGYFVAVLRRIKGLVG